MEKGVNQYKGLRTDISYDSIGEGFYIDAINMRITTTNGESQASVTNFKGNKLYFSIPQLGTGVTEITGVAYTRDIIIFFTADDSSLGGGIYKINYNEVTGELTSQPTLLYTNPDLGFSKSYPIEAVARYESDCIIRVYWVDYNNYFRSINIEDPDLSTTPVGLIDIFPSISYTQPLLTAVLGGGALDSGSYEYSFRLITFDGKESLISPPGRRIHAVRDSEGLAEVRKYNGDKYLTAGHNTFKSHEITIDTSDYLDYEFIELISAFKQSYTVTSEVTSVETKVIGTNTSIVFLHTGTETSATTLELFEYASKQYPFKTFKTLTTKDGSLVPANIKGSDFDAQGMLAGFNETFNAATIRYLKDGTPTANAFNEVYNKDAHWDKDWHEEYIATSANAGQYKYKSPTELSTLGGSSIATAPFLPNVSYNFKLQDFIIDDRSDPAIANLQNYTPTGNTTINLQDGYGNYANTTYDSEASPFRSGLIRGYKRGETYRFGIIFYNKKGEASFVEHIGDIKFPDVGEEDGATNVSGTNYFPLSRETDRTNAAAPNNNIDTTAYALGIEFDINFDSCPNFLSQIDSYQIVRVKRTNADSKRLCTGIMKVTQDFDMWYTGDSPGSIPTDGYDLRGPADEETIYHLFPDEPSYGANANFYTLNDWNSFSGGGSAGTSLDNHWTIYGDYLTFHSADISFDWGQEIRNSVVGEAGALLLMTGRYGQYITGNAFENAYTDAYSLAATGPFDASVEKLGSVIYDERRKLRTTAQVDRATNGATQAIEYVKKWNNKALVNFDLYNTPGTTGQELSVALGPYDGQLIRNFYAKLDSSQMGLNDHRASGLGNGSSLWCKGATGVTGNLGIITEDPLSGATLVTVSGSAEFRAENSASLVSPIAEAGLPLSETILKARLTSTPLLDILVPRAEIYGGFNQDALESNIFMPASPVIDKAQLNPIVFGGDIFVNMFVLQDRVAYLEPIFYQDKVAAKQEFDANNTSTTCYVTESRTNTDLSYGSTTKTQVLYDVSGGSAGVKHERWRQETANYSTDYGKHTSMYNGAYNNAYSTESDEVLFFIKPSNFEGNCAANDIRAFISDVKTNEETIDSWTKFGINNFYDVDDYGPINKVVNFKDEVYFFQDKGVGKYSINPRAIVSTEDGIPTELGSGEGFKDHTYITTENGAIHQWAVKATDSGIYYYDGIHKKIFKLGAEGNAPISDIKGIHGKLSGFNGDISLRKENGGDNPILGKGVHISRDNRNDEVLFSFLGVWEPRQLTGGVLYTQGDIIETTIPGYPGIVYYEVIETYTSITVGSHTALYNQLVSGYGVITTNIPSRDTTLVYDEMQGEFSSRYTAVPSIYIENGDLLLTPNPNDRKRIFRHNIGNFGEFYGTVEESSITMVLNKGADINKVLRFIEFNSIVRDSNKNIDRTQTITGFKIETEYQSTNKVTTLDTGRIKRKFDKWRLKIPRDQKNGGTDRLRSTHFVLTLYFDNTYNKELILNRITYYFDTQVF